MIKKIIEFIKNLFKVIDENIEEETIEEVVDKIVIEEPKIEPTEDEKVEKPIIEQEEEKKVVEVPKTTQKEVYVMLNNKERQTYLKKLGLYTKAIDNIRGSGQKKAEKIFNTIFLNKSSDSYTEETDKLLRIIYKSYVASAYMVDSDWKYFKNFSKGEFKCKCKGKGCNGYPSKIHMRTVMLAQYIRNRINAPFGLTSGLRCKLHNKNVGGVEKSKHLEGRALDGWGKNKKPADLMKIAKEVPFLNYTYQCGSSEIHTDIKM